MIIYKVTHEIYFYLDEWRNHISHCKCYHVGAHRHRNRSHRASVVWLVNLTTFKILKAYKISYKTYLFFCNGMLAIFFIDSTFLQKCMLMFLLVRFSYKFFL